MFNDQPTARCASENTAANGIDIPTPRCDDHNPKEPQPTSERSAVELPTRAEWIASKPGRLSCALIKLAGVDLSLAERMPADEQQQMKRVGLALIFGVLFQAICFGTAFVVGYGFHWWSLPVTFVLCGIMWAYDTKFVGADWSAQGAAYCRSHGLISDAPSFEWWSGPSAASIRWAMSLFIALTLAIFVLLHLFANDIEDYLIGVNRAQNAPLAIKATRRYQEIISDIVHRSKIDDEQLDQFARERSELLDRSAPSSTLDAQIAHLLTHIKSLQAAKSEAGKRAAAQAEGAQAELHGVRIRPDNTGIRGRGAFYEFHADMVRQEDVLIQHLDKEIANANSEITQLRAQQARNLADTSNARVERQRDLDTKIELTRRDRANLSAERKRLEDNKETWIADHMKGMSDYVPLPSGILAKLTGLWLIIAGNSLVAGLIFSVKVVVMLLESAGPVAKILFTKSGIYQMTVALRLHDETEAELDRRTKWQHWRELQRGRSYEAISRIAHTRRRQQTRDRAMDAIDKIVRKFSWVT